MSLLDLFFSLKIMKANKLIKLFSLTAMTSELLNYLNEELGVLLNEK